MRNKKILGVAFDLRFPLETNDQEIAALKMHAQLVVEFLSAFSKQRTIVELSDKLKDGAPLVILPDHKGAICLIKAFFDVKIYFGQPDLGRKKYLTDFILNQLFDINQRLGMSIEPLKDGARYFESLGYRNVYFVDKPKMSPDRAMQAKIRVDVASDGARVFAVYLKDGQLINEIEVVNLWPTIFFIKDIIKDGFWKSNSAFIIRDKSGEINFETHPASAEVSVRFTPDKRTLTDLEASLDLAKYKTTAEVRADLKIDFQRNG